MLSDDTLRLEVKALKAFKNVSYKCLGTELGIKPRSFSSWVRGDYNLSPANKRTLEQIIKKYKER